MSSEYPLAPQGVYRSLQGEGVLMGLPTVFVRLAGCSVNCPTCDTDYSVASRASAAEIASRVSSMLYVPGGWNPGRHREWIWITGGEPANYDLAPLVEELRRLPCLPRIAVATSGIKEIPVGWFLRGGVDFLSVSPHSFDGWVLRRGDQINLVPGLGGLTLEQCSAMAGEATAFPHRWLTPPESASPELLADCMAWVHRHPGWRLGIQAHKQWRLA